MTVTREAMARALPEIHVWQCECFNGQARGGTDVRCTQRTLGVADAALALVRGEQEELQREWETAHACAVEAVRRAEAAERAHTRAAQMFDDLHAADMRALSISEEKRDALRAQLQALQRAHARVREIAEIAADLFSEKLDGLDVLEKVEMADEIMARWRAALASPPGPTAVDESQTTVWAPAVPPSDVGGGGVSA